MELLDIYNSITPEQWDTLKSAAVIIGGLVVAVVVYFLNN